LLFNFSIITLEYFISMRLLGPNAAADDYEEEEEDDAKFNFS